MKIETISIAIVEAQRFLEAVERLKKQDEQRQLELAEKDPGWIKVLPDDNYPKSKYLSHVKHAALDLKLALMDIRSRG